MTIRLQQSAKAFCCEIYVFLANSFFGTNFKHKFSQLIFLLKICHLDFFQFVAYLDQDQAIYLRIAAKHLNAF
jgi:hypothetical protein